MPEQYKNRKRDNLPLWQKIISDIRFLATLAVFGMGGTVYGNSEAVRGLVHGQIAEADGQTEVLANGSTFAESMVKYTQEMNARVDALEGRVAVQKADLSLDDKNILSRLRSEITAVNKRLQAVEELVQ